MDALNSISGNLNNSEVLSGWISSDFQKFTKVPRDYSGDSVGNQNIVNWKSYGIHGVMPYNDGNRHVRERRVSESQSEVSSIGTDLSGSFIAQKLGLDTAVIKTEKVKIDRQKLENMIRNAADNQSSRNEADLFFECVEQSTTTHIHWPSRMKLDAKSKKDVHVRISGIPEQIRVAKETVLKALDSRGSRVTMKIDISYTDHSYIIGLGGTNIKQIMACTNTHIHFPDSNRSNQSEKSNQVSLNGTLEGVEKARALVRATAPLIISFPLQIPNHEIPESIKEYVLKVRETFDVEVTITNKSKLHNTLVLIKGSERNQSKVREATQLLINSMCSTLASQTDVNIQLEISPQHHNCVKGEKSEDLRNIMLETKTQIMFSDVTDANIKQIRKSQVIISGSIDGVYKARQQLIGNLPVTLSFDYPDYPIPELETIINIVANKYCVHISSRHKSKQNSNSIVVRGKEKFIDKIYEARQELLKLTTPLVKAEIPPTYFALSEYSNEFAYMKNMGRPDTAFTSNHPTHRFISHLDTFINQSSPYMSNCNNARPQININTSLSPHSIMQPRSSPSPRTSGYNSARSSNNSLDKLSLPFQHPFINVQSTLKGNNSFYDDQTTPTIFDVQNTFNFEKKIEGYKTMQRGLDGGDTCIRTPTNTWAGLGLSKTSPFAFESMRKSMDWVGNVASPYNLGNSIDICEPTSSSNLILGQHKDIHSLLIQLGLEHYINTFHVNEIDLDLFSTLTPENLTTLGIQAFGARKKLLMAINQLNASKSNLNRKFSGSAAPGAERRTSGDW